MSNSTPFVFRTLEQNTRLHKLVAMLKIDADHKAELVDTVSQGRVSSSKDLSMQECELLIRHLQQIVNEGDPAPSRMRRKIMSMCHVLGWTDSQGKVDYKRLSGWLNKYGYLHKPLNDYSIKELPALVTQFEKLLTTKYR